MTKLVSGAGVEAGSLGLGVIGWAFSDCADVEWFSLLAVPPEDSASPSVGIEVNEGVSAEGRGEDMVSTPFDEIPRLADYVEDSMLVVVTLNRQDLCMSMCIMRY
jgi:hypothetical protein